MKSGTEHSGLDYILSNESSEDIQKTYSGYGAPKSEYEGSQRELCFSKDGSEAYKLGVHSFTSIILGQALHTLGFPVIPEFPIKSMQGNKKRPGKKNWNQIINKKNSNDLGGGVVYQQRISPLEDSLKLHKLSQEELEETYGISSLDEKAFIPIPIEFEYTPESLDDISRHFFEYDKRSRIARAERIVDVFSGLNPVDALFGELRIQNCGTEDGELRVFDFGSELGLEPHKMHPIKYDNDGTPLRGSDGGYILDLESDTPEAKDARLWYFKMMNLGWISRGEIRNVHEAVNGIDVDQFSLAFENQNIEEKINNFKDSHSEHLKILKYFGGKFNGYELRKKFIEQQYEDGCRPLIGGETAEDFKFFGALWQKDLAHILHESKHTQHMSQASEVNNSGISGISAEDFFSHLLFIREAHLPNQFYFYDNGPEAVRLLSYVAATLRNPELELYRQKENPADSYIHEIFALGMRIVNLETELIDLDNRRLSLCGDILTKGLHGQQTLANTYISDLNALDDTIVTLMTNAFGELRKEVEANNYNSFSAIMGETTPVWDPASETFLKFDSYEDQLRHRCFEQGIVSQEAHHNFDDDETRAQRRNVYRIVSDKSPEAVKHIFGKSWN